MKKYLLPLILLSAVLGGCKKDNREPPKSTLSGVVVGGLLILNKQGPLFTTGPF